MQEKRKDSMMSSSAFIEAYLYGNKIGIIYEGANGIEFEYSNSFSLERYPISPLVMNVKKKYNYYDNMHLNGLPGIFADSISMGFAGNKGVFLGLF